MKSELDRAYNENMHESVHACMKPQKKGCPPLGRHPQLEIVGFLKPTLCWVLFNSASY